MKYAFDNANLLDGTKDMCVQPGLCVLTDGETITDIVPAGTAPAGYTRIDLRGRYLLPGLINMHVHLAGSGKIQKKQRDNEKLVRRILGNPVARGRVGPRGGPQGPAIAPVLQFAIVVRWPLQRTGVLGQQGLCVQRRAPGFAGLAHLPGRAGEGAQ